MSGGVFAVDRGVFDHPIFADEPFTEREAWIWLIGEAAWKRSRVRIGSVVVPLERGQAAHSIRFFAEKWRWHRSKVDRFFKRLKTETMIETHTETGVTVITICNYDVYQKVSLPSETPTETPNETAARQQRDREEDRKNRKDTSSLRSEVHATPRSELESVLDPEHAKAVVEHRKRIGKAMTPRAAKLLAGKFAACPDPNEAADTMIANGWQGFEPSWLDNRARNATGPPERAVNGFAAYALKLAEEDRERDSQNHTAGANGAAGTGPRPGDNDRSPDLLDFGRSDSDDAFSIADKPGT